MIKVLDGIKYVIPVRKDCKMPMSYWGVQQVDRERMARERHSVIAKVASKKIDYGIIMGVNDLVVVYIDEGLLHKVMDDLHEDKPMFVVRTPAGYHIYFRSNQFGHRSRVIQEKGAAGTMDMFCGKRYVVGPYSGTYTIVDASNSDFGRFKLVDTIAQTSLLTDFTLIHARFLN